MYRLTFISSIVLALLSLGIPSSAIAQGKITGKVIDGDTNDVLPFANIIIKGTSIGTTSDFDGKYELEIAAGTYSLEFSFTGYNTSQITDVIVKEGDNSTVNSTLQATTLTTIVISTTRRKNTEQAVLSLQKNAVQLLDGLSIETIKATGASNIASAVKNIPGVSVQGGKFVYVRGLGDRYTKTTLNGMDVPGLDPDRNTLQLDIFPTNILENLLVVKSATADQPADFTGGVVDIVTKDSSGKEEYSVSVGATYNSEMHFNNNYLDYDGGGTDFLGFDDGTRENPLENTPGILTLPQQDGAIARQNTQTFDPTLASKRNRNLTDLSLGFTAANKFNIGDHRFGYLASLSYKNETTYYDEYIDGQIFRKDDQNFSVMPLQTDRTQLGELSNQNTLMSGLLGVSYKTEQSKYRLNALHIQNGETETSIFNLSNFIVSSNRIKKDNLVYTERAITNLLLSGEHINEDASWKTSWKLSPTLSRVYDKDIRSTPFRINSNPDGTTSFTVEPSESGDATRIWRTLEETNLAGKIDVYKKHNLFGRSAKLKFGGAYTYKQRDFFIDQFSFPIQGNIGNTFTGDPNQFLAPENIYTPATDQGTFVRRDSNISDTFDASVSIAAAYIAEEFKISERFQAILGVRFEKFDLSYTGENQNGTIRLDEEKILDQSGFFPSANLILDLSEDAKQKLRASYSRTTARPSFKEASIAEIFDPVNSMFFIGNIDIKPTYINNFDLRYENYGEGANFFALSVFYKTFQDPIELSFIREARGQVTPLNLGDAMVYGAELEFRRRLDFIAGLQDFNISTNISVIISVQEFSEDEREARQSNLRVGERLDSNRTLQGQSPFLINFGINYRHPDNGFTGGIFYNTQGRTLQIVGNGDIPDVFTLPFHSIHLNFGKTFGEKKNSSLKLKFSNLFNDDRESVYESFGAEDETYSKWSPGQEISLHYSYTF